MSTLARYQCARPPAPLAPPPAPPAFRCTLPSGGCYHREPAPAPSEAVREAWMDSARQFARNEAYYRGLIETALKDVPDAYLCDDGTRSEDVLCAKLPDIVAALLAPSPPAVDAVREAAERLRHSLTPPRSTTDDGMLLVRAEDVEAVLRALSSPAAPAKDEVLIVCPKCGRNGDGACDECGGHGATIIHRDVKPETAPAPPGAAVPAPEAARRVVAVDHATGSDFTAEVEVDVHPDGTMEVVGVKRTPASADAWVREAAERARRVLFAAELHPRPNTELEGDLIAALTDLVDALDTGGDRG